MINIGRLLELEIENRGVSNRQAAKEMGLTHTTITRIIRGGSINVDTLLKISEWMNVPASALIDNQVDHDPLATEFALALRAEPRLAEIFTEALARVAAGRMSPTTFRELTAYAAYRINMDEGVDVDKEGPQQGVEDTS